jgi:hypothetical protein
VQEEEAIDRVHAPEHPVAAALSRFRIALDPALHVHHARRQRTQRLA